MARKVLGALGLPGECGREHNAGEIPRALSAFGLATVALLITGAMIPLSGHRAVMQRFMPMGLSQLALVLWLIARGFKDRSAVQAAS